MLKKGMKKCGLCRKVGHNKRTCGQVQKLTPPDKRQKPKTLPVAQLPLGTRENGWGWSVAKVNSGGVLKVGIVENEKNKEKSEKVNGEGMGMYSYDDLTTWWLLVNGDYGGRGKTSAELIKISADLKEMLNSSNLHTNETKQGWEKFLKRFPSEVKRELLTSYRNDCGFQTQDLPFTLAEIGEKLHENGSPTKEEEEWGSGEEVPPMLAEILLKSGGVGVKLELSKKPHLPLNVTHSLANSGHMEILETLAGNSTLQQEVLTTIYFKMKDVFLRKTDMRGNSIGGFQLTNLNTLKKILAHPNISSEILEDFTETPHMMNSSPLRARAFNNPHLPHASKVRIVNETKHQLTAAQREESGSVKVNMPRGKFFAIRRRMRELEMINTDAVVYGFATVNDAKKYIIQTLPKLAKRTMGGSGTIDVVRVAKTISATPFSGEDLEEIFNTIQRNAERADEGSLTPNLNTVTQTTTVILSGFLLNPNVPKRIVEHTYEKYKNTNGVEFQTVGEGSVTQGSVTHNSATHNSVTHDSVKHDSAKRNLAAYAEKLHRRQH